MKRKSHALANPTRRADYLDSEARYLARLSDQLQGSVAWDEQIALYEDYRNAHQSLIRVASLHGIDPDTLPALIASPMAPAAAMSA